MDRKIKALKISLSLWIVPALALLTGCQAPAESEQDVEVLAQLSSSPLASNAPQAPGIALVNNSKLRISLQDDSAGAPYTSALIRITEVDVHSSSEGRWYRIPIAPTEIDLTRLSSTTGLVLARAKAPAGSYDQIR